MSKQQHKGARAYRLQDSSNRKEIVFAKAWKELNKASDNETPRFLSHLLCREATEQDFETAATVLQWMGTKEGIRFVEDCLKKCQGLVRI